MWTVSKVMNMCIKNQYYTDGDAQQYEKMLDYVREHSNPSHRNYTRVAADIYFHSDCYDISREDNTIPKRILEQLQEL